MQHEVRKIGQEMLAELDRHVLIFEEMQRRDKILIDKYRKLSKVVEGNAKKIQKTRPEIEKYQAEIVRREEARKELADRLKKLMDSEEKLEEMGQLMVERKQELLAYTKEIHSMLRGGR